MATQAFQWGMGGQKLTTPEQVKKARAVAEALVNQPKATNWAEGLGRITGAISANALNERAATAETEGAQSAAAALSQLGSGASQEQIIAALSNPWVSGPQSQVATALLNNNLQQQDPLYQAQLANELNPAPENPYLNVGGGSIFNQSTGEFMTAPGSDQQALPADVQEYNFYADQATAAGQTPLPYLDYIQAQKGNGLSITTNPDGTTSITQGGPGKPLTEGQSKDTVYSTRARGALPTIDAYENALLSVGEDAAGNLPYGNFLQSEEYQLASTAGKEFLASVLRKDTGAAVTPDEEKNYGDVYLPRPGDKPARIAYKKQARARALAAIEAGLPPNAILAQENALSSSGGTTPIQPSSAAPADSGVIDWNDL